MIFTCRQSGGLDERIERPAFGRGLALLALACGFVTAALGLVVLIGWYTHDVALLRISPHFVAMAANTALGFLSGGAALLLISAEYRRHAAVIGAIGMLIGAFTLCEYVFHADLRIDQILVHEYVQAGILNSARMAISTALCLTMTGAAILLLAVRFADTIAARRVRRWALGAAANLGACVTGLGVIALSGYLAGIRDSYAWGELTRMAVHTSVGFIVLGIGIVLAAWWADCYRQSSAAAQTDSNAIHLPDWLPGLVGIAVVSATMCLWQALIVQKSADIATIRHLSAIAGIPTVGLAAGNRCCRWARWSPASFSPARSAARSTSPRWQPGAPTRSRAPTTG